MCPVFGGPALHLCTQRSTVHKPITAPLGCLVAVVVAFSAEQVASFSQVETIEVLGGKSAFHNLSASTSIAARRAASEASAVQKVLGGKSAFHNLSASASIAARRAASEASAVGGGTLAFDNRSATASLAPRRARSEAAVVRLRKWESGGDFEGRPRVGVRQWPDPDFEEVGTLDADSKAAGLARGSSTGAIGGGGLYGTAGGRRRSVATDGGLSSSWMSSTPQGGKLSRAVEPVWEELQSDEDDASRDPALGAVDGEDVVEWLEQGHSRARSAEVARNVANAVAKGLLEESAVISVSDNPAPPTVTVAQELATMVWDAIPEGVAFGTSNRQSGGSVGPAALAGRSEIDAKGVDDDGPPSPTAHEDMAAVFAPRRSPHGQSSNRHPAEKHQDGGQNATDGTGAVKDGGQNATDGTGAVKEGDQNVSNSTDNAKDFGQTLKEGDENATNRTDKEKEKQETMALLKQHFHSDTICVTASDSDHQQIGCAMGCPCSGSLSNFFWTCYPYYVGIVATNENATESTTYVNVGVCGISILVLVLVSVFIIVCFLASFLTLLMHIRRLQRATRLSSVGTPNR
eukprot:TRINITY_DN1141_c0_g1_i1.p1 TRINITY_DN1141_c0_g1~~TRINITY_DN1141_c0_g1_i1.p1  ORF type:complete len:575 (-),score=103.47 TRINITY_DN1141_c0_g1_i1:56-1780(-)